jgi:glycosyltransferase involved in cell wall biosynthesis
MKVYFINSNKEGCYNVRCLFPLQENGWDGDRTTFIPSRPTPENKARALMSSDIAVFHRPDTAESLVVARKLKEAGKKIVFDNDDTYQDYGGFKFTEFVNEEMVKKGLKTLNESLDTFAKEADLITCSTEFLKKEYEQINPNTIVLPNTVDPFYYPEPLRNDTDIVRIGITGSVGITADVEVLKPIIEHYQNDPRVRLVLLSLPPEGENEIYKKLYVNEYAFWNKVNIEWHSFVPYDQYYEYLNGLKLDFVIIPRADSYFNRCKSNLKFLENSMLEIPSVCQSFSTGDSPYEQNPSDKEYLLLATDTASWIEQIEKLINDKELRREMGKKAHEYVEREYSIEKHASKWKDAYSKLLDNNKKN